MTSHRPYRFLVSLVLPDSQVQLTNVPRRKSSVIEVDDVCCLEKGPLQIPIHVRSHRAIVDLTPRGMHPGRRP
jgi:hypothetical protein